MNFTPLILLVLLQTPFGYSRKDVLLIGLGVTVLGIGLKSGLEVPLSLSAYVVALYVKLAGVLQHIYSRLFVCDVLCSLLELILYRQEMWFSWFWFWD